MDHDKAFGITRLPVNKIRNTDCHTSGPLGSEIMKVRKTSKIKYETTKT